MRWTPMEVEREDSVGWREITESDFEGAAMPTNLIDILLTTPAMFKFDSL